MENNSVERLNLLRAKIEEDRISVKTSTFLSMLESLGFCSRNIEWGVNQGGESDWFLGVKRKADAALDLAMVDVFGEVASGDEPEFCDGHDYEGFEGGCSRMGCPSLCEKP